MGRSFSGLWILLFLSSPISPASIAEETLKNSGNYDDKDGTKVSSKLHEKCLQLDTAACVSYKLFNIAKGYLQNTTNTSSQSGDRTGKELRQKSDDQVDNILLQRFIDYMMSDSLLPPSDLDPAARRTYHLDKKMLLPLLMGVVLKFGSLIPIVLGKLAFVGTMAIMASKLSLLIISVMALKKLFTGSDGGMSQQGHYNHDQHSYYGGGSGGGQQAHQRVSYIIRGRQLGDQNFWAPDVEAEKRQFITDGDESNIDTRENESSVAPRSFYSQVPSRKSKSLKSTNLNSFMSVSNSRLRARNEETDMTNNIVQLQAARKKLEVKNGSQGRSSSHYALTSQGDNGVVPPEEVFYTHESTEPRVMSNTKGFRYSEHDNFMESVEDDDQESEDLSSQEEPAGRSSGTSRLVKRHHAIDMDAHRGQDHDRSYSAGQRRLDEVEGEHVDAWVIRRKMNHA